MSERYIERYTLPGQSYPLGCPVRLEGARLLEDTQPPRLVAQCKFTPVAVGVMALRVILQCTGENGADLGAVSFAYRDLQAVRGQSFGQYTAIVLPAGTRAFTVEAVGAVLLTGKSWSRAAAQAAQAQREAVQTPPIPAAPAASSEPEPAAEPAGQPAKAPAKKPRGKIIGIAAAVALAAILTVALVPRLMGGDAPKGNGPAQNAPVTAGENKAPGDAAPAAEGDMPSQVDPASPAASADPSASAAAPTGRPVQSADFGETGDMTRVYIRRDDSGYYSLDGPSITPYLPDATTICSNMGGFLTGDLMADLKGSFTFAWLVGVPPEDQYGLSGDWTMYPAQDGEPTQICVLAFDDAALRLVGYYMGIPEQYDEDTICFDMVLCDYDLAPLYEQERAAFEEGRGLLFQNYVAADADFEALGAKYYLWGYNTPAGDRPQDDGIQGYHLWEQLNSPYVADLVRDIDHLERRLEQGNRDPERHMLFLLLDGNYQVVGYTYMP